MHKFLKLAAAVAFWLITADSFSSGWTGINNATERPAEVVLVSGDGQATFLKFIVHGFNTHSVSTPQGAMNAIRIPGGSSLLESGYPDMAKLTASVRIPGDANMEVEVVSSAYTDFTGYEIAPAKGNLYRDVNPASVPFVFGEAYSRDEFYPSSLVSLREPYILRDHRGQTAVVYPFRYNPVSKVLRVYTEITIRVYENKNGRKAVNPLMGRTVKPVAEYETVYQNHFINPPPQVLYTVLPEQGNMLIISDASFMAAMAPFIEWKRKKGIPVEMVDIATVGTSEADIKSFVADYYNTTGLTYLLLVGDYQHIPSPMYSPAQTGGSSDPSYGYLSGTDSYAEVIVGRFSAQSIADVETQVQRVLEYEMTPVAGGAFYSKGVCVASDQGPGDDNEYDWEHERNIRNDLMGFTYTDVAELYDGSHGGQDSPGDPNSMDLYNLFQDGISIMSYTGHGSTNACSTTGLSSSDVAGMTNHDMLPFIWSVACVNGDFAMGDCLAEAFLRTQSAGKPAGAIAVLMASINQSWDPPMDGQDEMVDLLVGASVNNTMRTFGGLSVNGCLHMNDEYGNAGAEMTDTWHCFGDPSLQVRTAAPVSMTVTHAISVASGTSQLQVSCSLDSAFVSLTINGEIIGTGLVTGGIAGMSFQSLLVTDTVDVIVTAFNAMPYSGQVTVTGSTGIADGSVNSLPVAVMPNPAKDLAVIMLNVPVTGKITVRLYDESGKMVSVVTDQVFAAGKHRISLNTSGLNAGIYSCRVSSETRNENVQFTIVR